MEQRIIPHSYFLQEDVVGLAKDLIGKRIVTVVDGIYVSGIINETEAYAGVTDKASHAYANRRTHRTEVMYKSGGHIYVYLCYGMHALLNIVTNKKDVPHAILIRSIVPDSGIDEMIIRRKISNEKNLTNGPGKVSQALGITCQHTALPLNEKGLIWIEEGIKIPAESIKATPRIGIDYAEEDKDNPWRFVVTPSEVKNFIAQKNHS